MKRILLLLFLVISFNKIATAQSFTLGVKGAFNTSWLLNKNLKGDDTPDYNVTFGNSAGITTAMYFHNNTYYVKVIPGISLDILFTQHNQSITGKDSIYSFTSTTRLNFIDLPLLFRLTPEYGPYMEIGPQFSFLTNAKGDLTTDIPNALPYKDVDIKDGFNSFNVSAVLGFGVDITVTDQFAIIFGVRGTYGLTDISKNINGQAGYKPTHTATAGALLAIVYRLNEHHNKGVKGF